MTARIFIADDHELLREGVKAIFARYRPEWTICGESGNGEQAIHMVQELKPDLLILDITMPGISGLEACSRVRQLGITCPVLIFTTHQSGHLFEDVLKCGASGCVTKSQAARQLVQAIDALLSGGTFFGSPGSSEPSPSPSTTVPILFFCSPLLAT
jgi:DNA-binding NarL/FixJ family response regulator